MLSHPPVKIPLRLYQLLAAVVALGTIWLIILRVFVAVMSRRLDYFSPHQAILADPPCNNPECDFSAFWPAGLLARAHHFTQLYQPSGFLAFRQHILAAGVLRLSWFYPPPTLLPAMAISTLPFELGFLVWTMVLTGLAIILLRWARLPWLVIALGLASPAALWNLELGQLGILSSALLVAGLLMAEQAPLRAGIILGLLVLKPQPGLLTPVILLARRNWPALAVATGCAGGLILLVTVLLGTGVWPAYFAFGRTTSRQVLEAASYPHSYETFGVSVFWMIRSLGVAPPAAYAAQAAATLLAAIGAVMVWRRPIIGVSRMALTVFLSLLATPYGYTSDMVGYSIALAALAKQQQWRIGLLDALFWLWPGLCPIVTDASGILFTPLVVLLAAARTWRRAIAIPHLPGLASVLPRLR